MERRQFIKTTLATGIFASMNFDALAKALADGTVEVETAPDLVAVMGGEPDVMLAKALEALGGIGKFVKPGQTVAIKPNIAWDKTPELAANTNPVLVGALVKLCKEAGAKEVSVFDHTCDNEKRTHEASGIKAAVEKAGGRMLPGGDKAHYREVALPRGLKLKSALVHQAILDSDVWFNVPILKNHGGAKMTISMKNLMGIVWDRGYFHQNDLQQCIADIATIAKRPALNIVDAYRVLKSNGPRGKTAEDVTEVKSLIASPDMVALDTAAVALFNKVQKMDLAEVGHVAKAEALKVGTTQLDKLRIRRIKL